MALLSRVVRIHRTFSTISPRPPLPPFTKESAVQKVQAAEDAWNTKDPDKGRKQIKEFLVTKWEKEKHYKLKKHYFTHTENKIAVTFQYEYFNENENQWYRAYGNEHWTFDAQGYMAVRNASINDIKIHPAERILSGVTPREVDLGSYSDGTKR